MAADEVDPELVEAWAVWFRDSDEEGTAEELARLQEHLATHGFAIVRRLST